MVSSFTLSIDDRLVASSASRYGLLSGANSGHTENISIACPPAENRLSLFYDFPNIERGSQLHIKLGEGDYERIMLGMLISSPTKFIAAFLNVAKQISKFLRAKKFKTKEYDGKIRIDDNYDQISEGISLNIKSNVVLFDALQLIAK